MASRNVGRRTYRRGRAVYKEFRNALEPVLQSRLGRISGTILLVYVAIAVLAPYMPLREPFVTQRTAGGGVARSEAPSAEFPFGTTSLGQDVFAQAVISFRTSVLVGLAAGATVVFVGVNIGLIAGYYGGWVDTIPMAVADLLYGLPLYPFAIVVAAMVGQGTSVIVLVIVILLWTTIARVTRSETMSLKEREFVKAARAGGSNDAKIMYFQILPNLLPLVAVYFVFGATWAILLEAGLSFLALGDPNVISWGQMLRNAYNQAAYTSAWWWVVAPGALLWFLIMNLFIIARLIEDEERTDIRSQQ